MLERNYNDSRRGFISITVKKMIFADIKATGGQRTKGSFKNTRKKKKQKNVLQKERDITHTQS